MPTLFQLNTLMKEVILLLNTYHKAIFKHDCFILLVIYSVIILIYLSISSQLSKFIFYDIWQFSTPVNYIFLHKKINVSIHDIQLYLLLIVFQLFESLLSPPLTLPEGILKPLSSFISIVIILSSSLIIVTFFSTSISLCHLFFYFFYLKYSLVTNMNHYQLFSIQHIPFLF